MHVKPYCKEHGWTPPPQDPCACQKRWEFEGKPFFGCANPGSNHEQFRTDYLRDNDGKLIGPWCPVNNPRECERIDSDDESAIGLYEKPEYLGGSAVPGLYLAWNYNEGTNPHQSGNGEYIYRQCPVRRD
tara:strand:+ start:93 stop:482 length:390 start_codon:yes stop_codon:yes gene_type:complete